MANIPRFAIVGHPNKGKSSIVATLAEDESVSISAVPGTTTRATAYPMRLDGELLYELFDTPGFQRAREVLAWLDAHDVGAGGRAETVRAFVDAHRDDSRFRDECELLTPIMAGAGILYVVDGSRPYGRTYEAEMEILRRTGQPRMALINLIADGDHVDEWRAALDQYFSIVRVFDVMQADLDKRLDLLRAFGAVHEQWSEPLGRAVDALAADHARRRRRAAAVITDMLIDTLAATVTVPLTGAEADTATRERVEATLRGRVRDREARSRREVQEVFMHPALEATETGSAKLASDVFSSESFSVFGLSTRQLAITGAASGALAGGVIDVALGGSSLLAGAGVGAAIGAAGALLGAQRIAKFEILGQPVGGYQLRVGPLSNPNLPWVLLGRALLHARLVADRNHAHREALAIDATASQHLTDRIELSERRALERVFRELRAGKAPDAAARETVVAGIDQMLA